MCVCVYVCVLCVCVCVCVHVCVHQLTNCCPIKIKCATVENEGIVIDQVAKVNILLQSYVSRAEVDGFALVADMNHVVQAS